MDVKAALTKADNRHSGSSSFEVSISKQNPSPLSIHIDDEQPRQSTPPSATTQVESNDNEDKCKVEVDEPGNREIIDIEMDDDDVTIVPPTASIGTTTPNPGVKPGAEQDIQFADESRNFVEQEPLSDLEMQRKRQRQARRGPSPCSSPPQARSRKSLPSVSKTGVKRDREEYEDGQVDEDDHDAGIDESSIVQEKRNDFPVHGSTSTERQAILTDAEEIVMLEQDLKDDKPKRQKGEKVSTDGRQVTPQTGIKKMPPTVSTEKGPNSKATGKRSHYREFINPPISLTSLRSFVTTPQQSLPISSPQPRLPKKLGINHMDLLYKTDSEREVMVCRICL